MKKRVIKIWSMLMLLVMMASMVSLQKAHAADTPPNPMTKEGYTLDFSDEFDGPELDKTKWTDYYLPHWTHDAENAKAQYRFENGCLVEYITEDQGPWSPEHDGTVRSSAIMSFDKNWIHNFSGTTDNTQREDWIGYATTYGYFELRAKFADCGGGGHQAWWMVGLQDDTDDWFTSKRTGEIDIIESFFWRPNNWRIAAYGWKDPNFRTSWYSSDVPVPSGSPTTEFHIYAMDWSPGSLKFYYDNQLYKTINQSPDYPMGTILNIYTDAGSGVHNDVWPKQWAIDYFRVWKNDDGYPIPEPPTDPTAVLIKNRQTGEYLYADDTDKVKYGDVDITDTSCWWDPEQVGEYVRYKNRVTGGYLHIEEQLGYAQQDIVPGTYWSAQWKTVNAGGYVRLQNRWKTDQYLHTEARLGYVEYGNVPSTYWTSQWTIQSLQPVN